MNFYNIIITDKTPTASKDVFGIVGHVNRSWGIVEIDIHGNSAAANLTEVGLYYQTALGTGTAPGVITPVPQNPSTPAAGLVVRGDAAGVGWGTAEPTLGTLFHPCPANANGGRHSWRAPTIDRAYFLPGGAVAAAAVSCRALNINGAITIRIRIVEIC